jgi:hypothetical protein
MFDTYAVLTGIKAYLAPAVTAALAEISVTDTVKDWLVGWRNPYSLSRYDSALLVPLAPQDNEAEATLVKPIDCYVVAQASDAEALSKKLLAYIDAIYESVKSDDTLGGNVFASSVSDIDYIDPQSGTQITGIAVVTIRAELDTLGGF